MLEEFGADALHHKVIAFLRDPCVSGSGLLFGGEANSRN